MSDVDTGSALPPAKALDRKAQIRLLSLIGGALVFASSVSYAFYLSGSGPMIARLGAMRFAALSYSSLRA